MASENEQVRQSMRLVKNKRLMTKVLASPAVPLVLGFAHLYVIALYLRNPFQKVELN